MIAALPIGLLIGIGAVMEGETKGKRRPYGLLCGSLFLMSVASSYWLSHFSECSQVEVLSWSRFCGGSLLARLHYAVQLLAIFSVCTWFVSIWRGSLHRAKRAP